MPKPIEQMTTDEMRKRLVELQVEEEELWCKVQAIRLEKARVELALMERKGK